MKVKKIRAPRKAITDASASAVTAPIVPPKFVNTKNGIFPLMEYEEMQRKGLTTVQQQRIDALMLILKIWPTGPARQALIRILSGDF